jgi:hypothetical protein
VSPTPVPTTALTKDVLTIQLIGGDGDYVLDMNTDTLMVASAKLAWGKPQSRGKRGNHADADLQRQGVLSESVVVAVTNGRLDGPTERSPNSLALGIGSCQARQNG